MNQAEAPMKRVALALLLAALLVPCPAFAIEPAGGPPYPPGTQPEPAAVDAPDASVAERGWLSLDSDQDTTLATASDTRGSGFTLLAVLLVVGLGGSALWLQRRRRAASPSAAVESRLTLLSSTRVGPKAYAVSAEVNGRVLLLGVTDHSVTHLGWLEPPELEAAGAVEEAEPEAPPAAADDLPDDYPGSSLRATPNQPSPLTNSHNLRRFQEVLRGVVPDKPQSLRVPRMPRPQAPHSAPPPGDAASTLAALTSDVVEAESNAPPRRSVPPSSLRRKRQRRQQELSAPKPPKPAKAAPAEPPANPLEGQVAGLRALKNG